MEINKLKTYIQSSNVNFLFGSGLSKPYLSTLGDIEKWLTDLENNTAISEDIKKVIKASIYKEYFTKVIFPNYNPITTNTNYQTTINSYKNFLTVWNEIINKRANRLLSKQINIYSTNIDTLVENAVEDTKVEFNDGFHGSVRQVFDEGNFQKSYSKTSLHFHNLSEIPVFNLLKMHGSINWSETDSVISNDNALKTVHTINTELQNIDSSFFIVCSDLPTMITAATAITRAATFQHTIFDNFLQSYEKLIIVNPTKRKFSETVMDIHFYDLMRMFSNSMEKENTILFVMGFSFADEHIAKITLRAANTNPTLLVVIFAFDDGQETVFRDSEHLKLNTNPINNNIHILTPTKFKETNKVDDIEKKKIIDNISNFDLATINSIFELINNEIPVKYGK